MSNKRAKYQLDDTPGNATASSSRSRQLESEERELEAQLFGKRRAAGGSDSRLQDRLVVSNDDVEASDDSDDELAGLEDQDLFMLDDGPGMSALGARFANDSEADSNDSLSGEEEEDVLDDDSVSEDESAASGASSSRATRNPFASGRTESSARKKALWHDPSDEQVSVRLSENKRLRKLAQGKVGEESEVGGRELEKKLRSQFEKLHPAPSWATKPAKKAESAHTLSSLLQSTASFLSAPKRRGLLPSGSLSMTRLRDANFQSKVEGKREVEGGKGGINWVGFHPRVNSALAVVGGDRRLRIFNVDGHTNPSLLTLHIPSLPITDAMYHPSGASLLLTGPKPFYYTYDLATQRCLRSPPALFGLTKGTATATSPRSTEKSAFSPDGSVLAVAGRRGVITLVEWAPGGAGQLIGTINSGRTSGIRDLVFMKGGSQLWIMGEGSEVDVWDLGARRCVSRWRDQGGFGGATMACSKDRELMAVGSTSGFVNVYNTSSITSSMKAAEGSAESATGAPTPIRSLENLTTMPSIIAFNHDSQMMVAASAKKKDALKVYHLPSATAFKNWPTSGTPLGVVTAADFSAYGEYLAMGNQRGKVLLYSVNHYRDA